MSGGRPSVMWKCCRELRIESRLNPYVVAIEAASTGLLRLDRCSACVFRVRGLNAVEVNYKQISLHVQTLMHVDVASNNNMLIHIKIMPLLIYLFAHVVTMGHTVTAAT